MAKKKISGQLQKDGSVFVATVSEHENFYLSQYDAVCVERDGTVGIEPVKVSLPPIPEKDFFVAPQDVSISESFNLAKTRSVKLEPRATLDAGEAFTSVETANAKNYLGHNDWRLPTHDEFQLLRKSTDVGALKGTFGDKPAFYWTDDGAERTDGYVSTSNSLAWEVPAHLRLVRTVDNKPKP